MLAVIRNSKISTYRRLIAYLRMWGAMGYDRVWHRSFSSVVPPSNLHPSGKPNRVEIVTRAGRLDCIIIRNHSYAAGTAMPF